MENERDKEEEKRIETTSIALKVKLKRQIIIKKDAWLKTEQTTGNKVEKKRNKSSKCVFCNTFV